MSMVADTAELRDAFRGAMRKLASTVCVVTAADGDAWRGMTMTAVTSVSLDPPALLVCVNRATRLHGLLEPGAAFCVNVLRVGHDEVAEAFGGAMTGEDRFTVGAWSCEGGPPYLTDALANVFCTVSGAMEHGSHVIVVGGVEAVRATGPGAPLIYGDGRYGPAD